MPRTLNIFAPAKINLFLHVTGRRDDGYHLLDSLVGFADIGDEVRIEPSADFQFDITGPYQGAFSAKECDGGPSSSNLAVRAAWLTAREFRKSPDVKITLTKNLPLSAGIGGGTSDAAAVVWGLLEWWGLPKEPDIAQKFMRELGADFPVCFLCQPTHVMGIGEYLKQTYLPEIPVVLVNPGKPCPTRDVFLHRSGDFSERFSGDLQIDTVEELLQTVQQTRNDLHDAACDTVPEIDNVLRALDAETGCYVSRLSGSGATCFGLFDSPDAAEKAARSIQKNNPDWWVQHGMLNRPERY